MNNMNYCIECGTKLKLKYLEHEGEIPYCESCGEFRFPVFSTAVSMIVLNPEGNKMLLIKQYGRDDYILTAGYVNKGENAESAVCREIKEELGVGTLSLKFNRSSYFEKSNTLIFNFTAVIESEQLSTNHEVDSFAWFTFGEAAENVKKNSLAQSFVLDFLNGYKSKGVLI